MVAPRCFVLMIAILAAAGAEYIGGGASAANACTAALETACGADRHDVFACAQCAGVHQQQLQAAGCDNSAIAAWCAGAPPLADPFPGSRILLHNATWKSTANAWANGSATQAWELCYSSFTTDDARATAGNVAAFHAQCDMYSTTLMFARNALGYVFGGYVRRRPSFAVDHTVGIVFVNRRLPCALEGELRTLPPRCIADRACGWGLACARRRRGRGTLPPAARWVRTPAPGILGLRLPIPSVRITRPRRTSSSGCSRARRSASIRFLAGIQRTSLSVRAGGRCGASTAISSWVTTDRPAAPTATAGRAARTPAAPTRPAGA